MQTELVKICPVCGETAFDNLFKCKDQTFSHEYFFIQRCGGCQLLITNPRPDSKSIGKYYLSSNYISHSSQSNNFFDWIYFQARKIALKRKFNIISSLIKTGSLLDYGCGTGEFMRYMTNKRWEAAGVEPSTAARNKANQLFEKDSNPVKEKLEELPSKQFDIITLWHVLEHVPNPESLLTELKSMLSKDGFIFVAIPNHKSHDAAHYKEHWAGYDVPRHFWHFAPTQLQALLSNKGLKLHKIMPMKLDAYYVSLLSENYKNSGKHNLLSPVKAFVRGAISNAKGKNSMNYSSLIYIARHA